MMVFVIGWGRLFAHDDWSNSPIFYAVLGAVSGVFVFGTWIFALIPLYLWVPPKSVLWTWPVCTFCGAVFGAAVMFAFSPYSSPEADWKPLTSLAAGVGAVTCLFGSLTRRYFEDNNPNDRL
jgi:hypothetical protein